jgi:hypothetical protein
MPKVVDITVLNIDDVPYAVESLSEEVQSLVEIYNEWNRKEAEVRDELTRFQAAKETLSRQIIARVRADLETEQAAEAANEEVAAEEPAAADPVPAEPDSKD